MNPIFRKVAMWKLKDLLTAQWLDGYRTYVVAALYAITTGLQGAGLVPPEMWDLTETIKGTCLGLGFITVRAGMKNDVEKATGVNTRKVKRRAASHVRS